MHYTRVHSDGAFTHFMSTRRSCPTPLQVGAATLWSVAKGWEAARGFLRLLLGSDWETSRYHWLTGPPASGTAATGDAGGGGEDLEDSDVGTREDGRRLRASRTGRAEVLWEQAG